jgi:hypothetical protein
VFLILTRQSLKVMLLAWAARIASLVVVPNPGWLADTGIALFCVSGWLLILAGAFELRERREVRADRRATDIALVRRGALMRPVAHSHEMSAGIVKGYMSGAGWVDRTLLARHFITIPGDGPCYLCEMAARCCEGCGERLADTEWAGTGEQLCWNCCEARRSPGTG